MDQPLHAAEVHKGAERGEVGHAAADYVAGLQALQHFAAATGAGQRGPLGEHNPAAVEVQLDHFQQQPLFLPAGKIGFAIQFAAVRGAVHQMRGGHKAAQGVQANQQPSPVVAHHL